jgi:hypothetical protein
MNETAPTFDGGSDSGEVPQRMKARLPGKDEARAKVEGCKRTASDLRDTRKSRALCGRQFLLEQPSVFAGFGK